jgi:hypothetical protein
MPTKTLIIHYSTPTPIPTPALILSLIKPLPTAYALPWFCRCVNRFYAAESVRGTAMRAWADVMGSRGKAMVAQHAATAITYYLEIALPAPNHMVSEAACHALGKRYVVQNLLCINDGVKPRKEWISLSFFSSHPSAFFSPSLPFINI